MKKYLLIAIVLLVVACTPSNETPASTPTPAAAQPTAQPISTATPPPTLLLDDFDHPTSSAWAFDTCGSAPSAQGALKPAVGHTGQGINLDYQFTAQTQCVQAVRQVELPPTTAMIAFWVKNLPTVALTLNLRDASGQTLTYALTRPLEATDSNAWYHLSVALDSPDQSTGGAHDGVIHAGIRALSISATPVDSAEEGAVAFDDIAAQAASLIYLDPRALATIPVAPDAANLLSRLGVNAHFEQGPDDPELQIAAAAGFTWVRTDLTWSEVETQPDVYDFSRYDQIVSRAEALGMKVLLILDYGNALHTGGPRVPPTTAAAISAFGDYAEDVARHFAGHAVAYEIWNEPNNTTFWPPQPDPQTYAQLADEAALHIRLGDPAAPVIMGGLALFDFGFLQATLAQPHSALYNAISVHPYLDRPERLTELAARMRSIIDDSLPSQPPIWISEWGYSSVCPATSSGVAVCDRQALLATRQLLTAWAQDFPLIVYYELRDGGDPSSADAEDHFGLAAHDGSAKPALLAVQTLTAIARTRTYTGLLPLAPSSLHAMRLDGANDLVIALWLDRPGEQISVALPPATTGVDLIGKPITLTAGGQQLLLTLHESDGPVYLTFPKK